MHEGVATSIQRRGASTVPERPPPKEPSMTNRKGFQYLPGLTLAAAALVAGVTGGCSAASSLSQAQSGCGGLDTAHSQAQASVKAFADAVEDLNKAANDLQQEWLTVCNNLNTAV